MSELWLSDLIDKTLCHPEGVPHNPHQQHLVVMPVNHAIVDPEFATVNLATGRRGLSKDTTADVSVIIVNYGTAVLALEAVASVLDQGNRLREVHLVDNASPGNDAEMMAQAIAERGWGGRVRLHAERTNHGFGRGNNLVLEQLANQATPPDKVFLLNPDARLDNAAIDILATFLDAHARVGAAGARIEKPGQVPVTAAFRFPE